MRLQGKGKAVSGLAVWLAALLCCGALGSCGGQAAGGGTSAKGQEQFSGTVSQAEEEKPPGQTAGDVSGTASQAEEEKAPGQATEDVPGTASQAGEERNPGQAAGDTSGSPCGDAPEHSGESASACVPGAEKTPSESPSGEEPSLPEITLVMVGDILLHTPVAESGEREEGGYDFRPVFANVKEEIESADIALVNQEVIIGGEELGVSGYPSFNAPFELGDALVDAGFDVVLHATNHALDKRRKGLLNCLAFWEENYPEEAVLGIHGSEEDSREIYIYEQDGIRVAILNYTYGTNGVALPEDMPYAVDLLEKEKVAEDLRRAEELADFTVVCPHWGTEYKLNQSKKQEEWAELFADNGADLIIGTHPHVIEPVVWLTPDGKGGWEQTPEQEEPGEGMLVYYSLGNFVNWTSGKKKGVANRMVGGMARVTIGVDAEGEVRVTDWGVDPLVCHLEQGFGGVTVYFLEEYSDELAERNEIRKQDDSFSYEYCLDLAEQVFGEAAFRR